jgi:hypothetical protein
LHLNLDDQPSEVAYCVMDDLNGDNGAKRWGGAYTPPDPPQFKQEPWILAAVTTVRRKTTRDGLFIGQSTHGAGHLRPTSVGAGAAGR